MAQEERILSGLKVCLASTVVSCRSLHLDLSNKNTVPLMAISTRRFPQSCSIRAQQTRYYPSDTLPKNSDFLDTRGLAQKSITYVLLTRQ